MTHWQTLTELNAQRGDEVEHRHGNRFEIAGINAYGQYLPRGSLLSLENTRDWRMVETFADREARMRDEQREGTA